MNSRRLIRSPRRREASSVAGTSRPSIIAVPELMTSSNLVNCADRQVSGLGTLEDAAGVDADLTIRIRECWLRSSSARRFRQIRRPAYVAGTAWRVARRINWTRRLVKRGSPLTKSASGRSRTKVAKAASISPPVLALRTWTCSPMARAAASTSLKEVSAVAGIGRIDEHRNTTRLRAPARAGVPAVLPPTRS